MADKPEWDFSQLGEDILGDVSTAMPDMETDIGSDFSIDLEESITDFPIEGDGECVVCGAPTFRPPGLTKGGNRKRVPKFCDEHDPKQERTTVRGQRATGLDPALGRVAEEIADDIKLLGTFAGLMYPVTGYFLIENADPFTVALVKLAGKNPAFLKILHRTAQVAPIYEVLKGLAGVGVAVQVDLDKIEPHSFAAEHTGVGKAYDAVYPNGKNEYSNNGFNQEGPPVFRTVG